MISAAMLSRWHVHAEDYTREARANSNIEIKMVWDEDTQRGEQWGRELGVTFEPSLERVLDNPEIDAVIVTTPTSLHYDVIMAAIQAGKHVFTEKVLAFTRQQCLDMLDAAEKAGVKLMVSLPRLTHSYYLYTQAALNAGLVGQLTSIRCRVAHDGALPNQQSAKGWLPEHFFDANLCGGGALIDLGAHPIYLTNRLAGQPTNVMARLGSFMDRGVDDNSAVIVEYDSGVLGILEVGFVASSSPFVLEVHGTEGSVIVEDTTVRLRSRKLPERRWYTVNPEQASESDQSEANAQSDANALSDYLGSALETLTSTHVLSGGTATHPSLPMPMEQWATWILDGVSPTIYGSDIVGLTAVNEAAAKSDAEGRRVSVDPFTVN